MKPQRHICYIGSATAGVHIHVEKADTPIETLKRELHALFLAYNLTLERINDIDPDYKPPHQITEYTKV